MRYINPVLTKTFAASLVVLALGSVNARGEIAERFEDIQDGGLAFGAINVFNDAQGTYALDETAIWEGNDILVATLIGPSEFNGFGISVPISNGENGKDSSDGGMNEDIPNLEPVNPAIVNQNPGSGKLSNGNIIRASVWMRSDPSSPAKGSATTGNMTQVEGILKIELYKEALSTFGDYEGPGDSDYGDRIWDQDQQGGAGSNVDINSDGNAGGFSQPVSLTLATDEWRQMVVEYVVDDAPTDPGNTFMPWNIGPDAFTVADVEDVRAVFYSGDWSGDNFTDGGSWWMDNYAIEVFSDQAAANAVDPAEANPMPLAGQPGDYDADGDVDGQDFLVAQEFGEDIPTWEANYPFVPPLSGISSVPEPSSAVLCMLCAVLGSSRRRR